MADEMTVGSITNLGPSTAPTEAQISNIERLVSNPRKPFRTLDELQALCDRPILCRIELDGEWVEIPCRRLRPAETERINLIMLNAIENAEIVLRAISARQKPNEKVPEADEAEVKRQMRLKSENERDAIAMAVYLGCPLFSEGRPNLKDRKEISEYVYSKLTETIIQILYRTIVEGGIGLEERVNFSSTSYPTL